MAAAAPPPPPLLSISVPTSNAGSQPQQIGGATAPPQIATPAFSRFLSRLSDSVRRSLANRRPWSELADRSAFSRPDSLTDAVSRVRKNLSYFRINYIALLAAVLALSLLSHPFSLLTLLVLLAAWFFLYLFRPSDQPLTILGRQFSDRETLGVLVLLTVFVVFLTSVGSLLISAFMVGAAIVCVHGAFRMPEDLFLDDQEAGGATTGFLSFLGGAASSAAAAAGPAMAVRV